MDPIGHALSAWFRIAAADLPLSIQRGAIEFYADLPPIEQVAVALVGALVVGGVVLGILPDYSNATVRTARRSPVISLVIGLPSVLVIGFFLYIASEISGNSIGVFFAIPLVSIGLTLLPAWTALGLVAAGCSLGNKVGRDELAIGLVVGSLGVGIAAAAPELLAGVLGLVAALGSGAGVRVLMGSGTGTDPDERTVPPANQI